MTYTIRNSRNTTVATVSDVTVNTSTPLNLIGRGVAGYGEYWAQDFYYLLENFAKDTAPASPATGMIWYDLTSGSETMKYWDGSSWISFGTASTASGVLLSRLGTASNIDFEVATNYSLHTAATGKRTMITGLMLLPRAGASITPSNPPPAFNLNVSSSGDIMDTTILTGIVDNTEFAFYNISGVHKIVTGGQTVKLTVDQVVQPADTFAVDAYLFGHVRT